MAQPPQSLNDVARTQIKSWIASTGITQTALGQRIGRNQAWMSRYISGDIEADVDTLQQIAKEFGHSLTSLLSIPTDPEEANILKMYRSLSEDGRKALLMALRDWSRPRGRGHSRR